MTLLLWTGAIFLLIFAAMPYVPWSSLATDLFSHFVLQCAIGAVLLLVLGIVFRVADRALYVTLLVIYFLCVHQMWPYLATAKKAETTGPALKVLQANTWVLNHDADRLKALIAAENPDLILAAEVNTPFAAMFETLDAYPHRRVIVMDDSSFGLAVLSKLPLQNLEVKHLAVPDIPSIFFRIEVDGKALDVAALHAANPVKDFAARDREFEALAAWHEQAKPQNLLVAGDLNATRYCPAFKRLVRRMNLREARAGRGFLGTYPVQARAPFLRLPIDHALTGGGVAAEDFRLGPDIGSDHLPTLTVIRL